MARALNKEIAGRIRSEAAVQLERDKLQQALAEVKKLSGMPPICAGCKKIKDDNGYWTQIEKYINDRSEAVFSHGLCPDCARKLYPGILDDVE